MKKRIDWIDWAKSLAIFLMVLLHAHCNNTLDSFISGFRMPLFFMISGFLFSYENNPDGGRFTNKRFRQLVVPYLWINLVAYLFWVTILRNYGTNTADTLSWHTPLLGIFTGVGPLLIHDIPTWSLLSFFVVEIIFYFLVKYEINWWWVSIISLIIYIAIINFIPEYAGRLPLVIGPSIAGLFFYSVGYGVRRTFLVKYLIPQDDRRLHYGYFITFIICLLIYIPSVYYNTTASFYLCKVGNLPLFLLSSFSGSALIVIFFIALTRIVKSPPLIRFISVGTLLICGFHLLIFAFLKGVALFGLGINPDDLTSGLLKGFIFAVVTTILTFPIIWIVRTYARPLVDK